LPVLACGSALKWPPKVGPRAKQEETRESSPSQPLDHSTCPLKRSTREPLRSIRQSYRSTQPLGRSIREPHRSIRPVDRSSHRLLHSIHPVEGSSWPLGRFIQPLERSIRQPLHSIRRVDHSTRPLERSIRPLLRSIQPVDHAMRPLERSTRQPHRSTQRIERSPCRMKYFHATKPRSENGQVFSRPVALPRVRSTQCDRVDIRARCARPLHEFFYARPLGRGPRTRLPAQAKDYDTLLPRE